MSDHRKSANKLGIVADHDPVSRLVNLWKRSFADSQILVNLPGNVTLTHSWQPNHIGMPPVKMTVNGIMFDHPLVQNALYGYEHKAENNRTANFYEIMLPEMDGYGTQLSATEAYTRALTDNGLQVQGDHFHWASMSPKTYAIHHSAFGMDPLDFSTLTISALTIYATQYVRNKKHWLKRQATLKGIPIACVNDFCQCIECSCKDGCKCAAAPAQTNSAALAVANSMNNAALTTTNNMTAGASAALATASSMNCSAGASSVLQQWQIGFPDASLLVQSPNNITITHTLKGNQLGISQRIPKVRGVTWSQPLIVNALVGYQTKDNVVGNWYEVLLPEADGIGGNCPSACEAYTRELNNLGLYVEGYHYHWKSMSPKTYAIHHSKLSISPLEFARLSCIALQRYATQYNYNVKLRLLALR